MKHHALLAAALCLTGLVQGQVSEQTTASTAQTTQTRSLTAEQRAEQHRARINEVMKLNRLFHEAGATTQPRPQIVDAADFDARPTHLPMLKEAGISSEQIEQIRSLNAQLWEVGKQATEPFTQESKEKAKLLLEKYYNVLTPAQRDKLIEVHNAYMAKVRSQYRTAQTTASAAQTSAPAEQK